MSITLDQVKTEIKRAIYAEIPSAVFVHKPTRVLVEIDGVRTEPNALEIVGEQADDTSDVVFRFATH